MEKNTETEMNTRQYKGVKKGSKEVDNPIICASSGLVKNYIEKDCLNNYTQTKYIYTYI